MADSLNTVNVQVTVRCRPMSEEEQLVSKGACIAADHRKKTIQFLESQKKGGASTRSFHFDNVFGPEATQKDVYELVARPIVRDVLSGFNCTIFAYGATGTGKTYTMEGEMVDKNALSGVIPRAVQHIFKELNKNKLEHTVRVSCLELYNEELVDLLASEEAEAKPLRLLEDKRGVVVNNLEETIVSREFDIFSIIQRVSLKRHKAETNLNKASSRSHVIFTVTIITKEATPGGEDLVKIGKLNLVDLAGSENIGKSGAREKRAREAGMINQSLLTLGRVINALVERQPHVPYRESKLTRLLQESLGGRAKTAIIATIGPHCRMQEETLSTLDYAHRAKNIRNRPEVNQRLTQRSLIREYTKEIEKLKMELQAAREKNGIFLPPEQFESMENALKHHQEQVGEMEATLHQREKELEDLKQCFAQKDLDLIEAQETHARLEVQVQEKQVVIEKQRDAGVALAEQAHQMHATLKATVHDVNGLHDKIERKTVVTTENKQHDQQFSTYLLDRIGHLEQCEADFNSRQATTHDSLNRSVNALAATHSDHLQRIEAAARQSMADVSERLSHFSAVIEQFTNATTQQNESAVLESAAARTVMALTKSKNELSDQLDAISTSMAAQTATVKGAAEAVRQSIIESTRLYAQHVDNQKAEMSQLRTSIDTVLAKQSEVLSNQRADLGRLEASSKHQAATAQNELLQGITSLVTAFAATQQQHLGGHVQDLQTSLQSQEEQLADGMSSLKTGVDGMENSIGAWSGPTTTMHERIVTEFDAMISLQAQSSDSAARQALEAPKLVAEGIDAVQKDIGATFDLVSQANHEGILRAKQFRDEYEAQAASIAAACDGHIETLVGPKKSQPDLDSLDLGGVLGVASQSHRTSVTECNNAITQQQGNSAAFHKDHGERIAVLKADVPQFFATRKEDVSVGNTPVKRTFEVPSDDELICLPQEKEIVSALQQQFVEAVGDKEVGVETTGSVATDENAGNEVIA